MHIKICRLKVLLHLLCLMASISLHAQRNNNHLMASVGALYENGLDATISYEHSTNYHNAWEFFGSYYIKYAKDELCGHYTSKSFWHNYNSWHLGVCYKPCVGRGRNHFSNVRIGASGGSNTDKFLGGIHLGYEYTHSLYKGWEVFFQVKEDIFIPKRSGLFHTGVALGIKIPM